MADPSQTEKFAAFLRMLKDRSGRGYDRLGKEAGVSGSSLHRYCSGLGVPGDYRVVHSFGKVCGASPEELRELHRLWALADTDRNVPAAATAAGTTAPAVPTGEGEGEPGPKAASAKVASAAEAPAGSAGTAPGPGDAVAPQTDTAGAGEPRRGRLPEKLSSRFAVLAAAVVAVTGLVAGFVWMPADPPPTSEEGLLYSSACKSVSMGQHDECVREVQTLLVRAKGRLAVDGDFGPETLRRLTAFQVLAGMPASSVVDEGTKKALYAQQVSMATWSPDRVTKRIREVFAEDPGTAVAIARCASFLDPLWVLPNTNGSRNWGVFQISDVRLRELGGTPRRAFDPEWNIRAAHRLWSVRHDFHDWPSCEAALKDSKESKDTKDTKGSQGVKASAGAKGAAKS
ncbi:helix-turn-helix domain-containing protein [Streptomyces sp. NPDC056738]|uniref:helix-turn-helix domain-containing protein n=1 Tax=Streptomyces sp. NPDC056738 TaxID=3345933 RepID=UPI0036C2EF8D